MEHDIPFGNSNREDGPTFLDFPLFLGIFQWDEPTKRVPFTAEPEIPEILTKWKAPTILGNYMRASMGKSRISLLHIHYDSTVDLDVVLYTYGRPHPKRIGQENLL